MEATPGLCPPRQSLSLCPPRPMCTISITFVTPVSHCSVCDVDEAFSVGQSYTIFEVEGRFSRKPEKPSQNCGRETCFHEVRRRQSARAETSILEVEALLDLLFCHINMPAHVAHEGIPPSVTSNPSPSYIRSVAMPSGVEYDGKTYSDSYGDLGAMANPLHPEARSSDVKQNTVAPSVSSWSKSFTR